MLAVFLTKFWKISHGKRQTIAGIVQQLALVRKTVRCLYLCMKISFGMFEWMSNVALKTEHTKKLSFHIFCWLNYNERCLSPLYNVATILFTGWKKSFVCSTCVWQISRSVIKKTAVVTWIGLPTVFSKHPNRFHKNWYLQTLFSQCYHRLEQLRTGGSSKTVQNVKAQNSHCP